MKFVLWKNLENAHKLLNEERYMNRLFKSRILIWNYIKMNFKKSGCKDTKLDWSYP
jgi:hypothetical protein